MEKFIPRKFEALIDEHGEDDLGFSGITFTVQSLKKGEIYEESDPRCIEGNRRGVVIDNNGCWWHFGNDSFNKRFKEVS